MQGQDKGWIKLYRKSQDHWLFTERRKFSKWEAWVDMLMTVNHKDANIIAGNTVIDCKRGQSLLSLDSWAQRWLWNKTAVRRFFKLLEGQHMIIYENVLKTTRITICNYDSYQDVRNANETIENRKRNMNEIQMAPIKECKNDKNEIKEESKVGVTRQNTLKKTFGKTEFRNSLIELGANAQHVEDWIEVRVQKKAAFTETVLQSLIKECQKNNFSIADAVRICAEHSWQGFQYKWTLNRNDKQKAEFTEYIKEAESITLQNGKVINLNQIPDLAIDIRRALVNKGLVTKEQAAI